MVLYDIVKIRRLDLCFLRFMVTTVNSGKIVGMARCDYSFTILREKFAVLMVQ